ncbi:hypothetical protein BW721_01355 [Jeotgalibaca sp. PTS2502]|uniref:helix-turn-helix domain-containing protein n=2 Tax=Lactobacillales TaxID=186826 RepID=UPI000973A198|nr:helix-turn-helix domain-containing protein [Jeotgalibaca sp. PTS2502]APZ48442.1 hypothetical protein BW721_01355 [Jeotgalibaca sp. PTS2502]
MSKKYSVDLKLKIVQEYLQGTMGARVLAKKYDLSSKSLVTKWINQYKQFGEAGLRHQITKQDYPLNFKLDVLRFKQDTGASYKETANLFNIKEQSIIANWKRTYLTEGAKGLNKPQGRPPKMPKYSKNVKGSNKKSTPKTDELNLLKQENEYLRLELAYLKKLRALGLKDPRANNKP